MKSAGSQEFEGINHQETRLRRADFGALLAVKLLPIELRAAQIWLHGFCLDVSQIPYRVDEPLLGEIRLQWWRDSLSKILRGEKIGHPVADGLGPFLLDIGAPLESSLLQFIDSFGSEVQKTAHKTTSEFFTPLSERYGGFYHASFLLAGVDPAPRCEMIEKVATAVGVSEVIAHLPRSLEKSMTLLPQDLLDSYNISYQDFVTNQPMPDVSKKIHKMLTTLGHEAMVTSWDIKTHLASCSRQERQLLARWYLVPALLTKAIDDRSRGTFEVSALNPLKQYFTLMRHCWL